MEQVGLTPLIVSGPPRSGTSLLYNFFDCHPEILWLGTEGYLFEFLHDLEPYGVNLFLNAITKSGLDIVEGIRECDLMPPLHKPIQQGRSGASVAPKTFHVNWFEDAFLSSLSTFMPDSVATLWHGLAHAYAAGLGQSRRRYACMKAPDFGKSTLAAITHDNDARGLVIVRNPIQAIDSLKRSRQRRGAKLLTWPILAAHLCEYVHMQERIAASDSRRILVTRYETLVCEPITEMKRIASFLEIDWHPSLERPTVFGKSWTSNSSFAASDHVANTNVNRPPQCLTSSEVSYISTSLQEFFDAYDYQAA